MNVSLHTELIIILCYTVNDVACEIPAKKYSRWFRPKKGTLGNEKKASPKNCDFIFFGNLHLKKKIDCFDSNCLIYIFINSWKTLWNSFNKFLKQIPTVFFFFHYYQFGFTAKWKNVSVRIFFQNLISVGKNRIFADLC